MLADELFPPTVTITDTSLAGGPGDPCDGGQTVNGNGVLSFQPAGGTVDNGQCVWMLQCAGGGSPAAAAAER